ncbi:type II toxin-antitoxin system PemK/MazF family toxin [Clavibacter nebraskensis]|uniref:mRNA interferase n=1 Tax=Clavibacter nebraskensis NCPPB 2581 TaxID=1097677 RepID=A0AAI8ZGT8_9MICO|nr:type II toxin-antitoxin system PemK/MazF family toxin [Clavibacter nebraskensis]KXU21530.1 transcription elongation factor GreAB [Clavibacter nebraskensis]OAH19093.1 transcription elongation factor GreAB [Clavibacter nebraskensis]CCE74729.1 toxin/antitoxin system [Clavibacter nebraskensis NCPPB 2581]
MISRGDVVWVDVGAPRGSEPAKIRPALVIQDDWINESGVATIVIIPFTSQVRLQVFPGNVFIPAAASGLGKDSVAVVPQIGPVSREFIEPYPVGHLPGYLMAEVSAAVRLLLAV